MNGQNTGIQLAVHQIEEDGDDDREVNSEEDNSSRRWKGRLSDGAVEEAMTVSC